MQKFKKEVMSEIELVSPTNEGIIPLDSGEKLYKENDKIALIDA